MKVFSLSMTAASFVCAHAHAQVQTFPNNYPGFLQAAGSVRTIDFETLPDGMPSDGHQGAAIDASFNYDLQGAHFSAPVSFPYIAGPGGPAGIDLAAGFPGSPDRTWIIADMTTPARAVGVFFGGGTTLYAYAFGGSLLGSVGYGASGPGHFIGIVSPSVSIGRVVVDRGGNLEDIESFVFAPVPEPSSAALVAFGLGWVTRRARRRVRAI